MIDQPIQQGAQIASSTSSTILWPERPICHDSDWQAQRFGQTSWRPKGEKLHPSNDLPMAFRTCSYCGSIHPEDLIEAIKAGATLGGADWKYGWPHKFYVDKIPNPNAGQPRSFTSMSIAGPEPTEEERASMQQYADRPDCELRVVQDGFSSSDGKPRYRLSVFQPDDPTTHGKFYNEHLNDLSPEAFAELAPLLEQRTGIKFGRDEQGRLGYSAPRQGYQR